MGLDCSHGAFNGAYSAFNRFRRAICAAIGGSWPPHDPAWRNPTGGTPGDDEWYYDDDAVPAEHMAGMLAIMEHSDCGGELTPEQCRNVSGFLRWAAPRMTGETGGHLIRAGLAMGDVAIRFAAGCDLAAAAGESLTFG